MRKAITERVTQVFIVFFRRFELLFTAWKFLTVMEMKNISTTSVCLHNVNVEQRRVSCQSDWTAEENGFSSATMYLILLLMFWGHPKWQALVVKLFWYLIILSCNKARIVIDCIAQLSTERAKNLRWSRYVNNVIHFKNSNYQNEFRFLNIIWEGKWDFCVAKSFELYQYVLSYRYFLVWCENVYQALKVDLVYFW